VVEFLKSNGGSPKKERNDCSVRALAIATDTSYWDAYKILANFGRKPNTGVLILNFFKKHKNILNHKFIKLRFRKQITLNKFVKKYPFGTYYVHISKHVFVIKDGVAIDSVKPKKFCRIIHAWEVIK